MREVSVKEAREQIGHLLRAVEQGEEITIQRYRKPVARLVPVQQGELIFPEMKEFRISLDKVGITTLSQLRDEERY